MGVGSQTKVNFKWEWEQRAEWSSVVVLLGSAPPTFSWWSVCPHALVQPLSPGGPLF